MATAVRDARNRDALLTPLGALGVQEIRILSGGEEGRLGAEAALRASPLERGMVADLGGGSLQVTPVEAGNIQPSQSAPLGVARLLRRFLQHDPAKPNELDALRAELRVHLPRLLEHALAAGEISALRAWLEPMTAQHRSSARRVSPDRADVIVGAIVLEELLAASRYPALTVSRTSVREGVLWREAEKLVRAPAR